MKMKFSLRRQMTIVFIGLLVFILGAVFIVNTGFLGQYYISHKVQDLLDTYDGGPPDGRAGRRHRGRR